MRAFWLGLTLQAITALQMHAIWDDDSIKENGMKAGIAINPDTDVNVLKEFIKDIDEGNFPSSGYEVNVDDDLVVSLCNEIDKK